VICGQLRLCVDYFLLKVRAGRIDVLLQFEFFERSIEIFLLFENGTQSVVLQNPIDGRYRYRSWAISPSLKTDKFSRGNIGSNIQSEKKATRRERHAQ